MDFRRTVALGAFGVLLLAACGDVKSELITGATGGSAGAPGGASTGGTSSGASGVGGASVGGAGAGGANTGGSNAGSSSSGTSGGAGGSGGTPECTPETADTDCPGPERTLCDPDSRTCVECTAEAHCDADENCSHALGECAASCTATSDCTDDEDRFCDLAIGGFCVECLADADCPSGQCSNWSCD